MFTIIILLMGTTANLCINRRYVSTDELSIDTGRDEAVSDEYKRKTKTDDTLKMLHSQKVSALNSPKTYSRGNVKVSVF